MYDRILTDPTARGAPCSSGSVLLIRIFQCIQNGDSIGHDENTLSGFTRTILDSS